jgi:excisionase family DNA binding protein
MTRPQPSARRLMRVKEAARYLCLSPWKLRHIIQSGQLPIVRHSENAPWLLDVQDLDGWVERNKLIIE